MPISAGSLDRRIALQRATITRDEYNEEVSTWATFATRSASYEPVPDGEKFRAGERASEIGARFVIRWSQAVRDLSPKDQLVFDGRTYAITRVKEISRREGLELTAVSRDDG